MKAAKGLSFILLVCSSVCFAQQTIAPAEKPSREEVLKYLNALHVRETMDQMMVGMKKQMKAGVEEGFKHKVPNATPEQLAKASALFDDVFTEINTDEMIDHSHLSGTRLQG